MPKRPVRRPRRTAVAYLRASKDEQRLSSRSPARQHRGLGRRASVRVAVWCIDQGVRSVSPIAERPALRAALAALREHERACSSLPNAIGSRGRRARGGRRARRDDRGCPRRERQRRGQRRLARRRVHPHRDRRRSPVRARPDSRPNLRRACGQASPRRTRRLGAVRLRARRATACASSLIERERRRSRALANFAPRPVASRRCGAARRRRGTSAARGGVLCADRSHACSIGARSHPSESPLTSFGAPTNLGATMSGQPIFRVTNHHTDACGAPPAIDDSEPNRYLGYFENEHGEQASLRVRPHSSDGNVVAGRRWVGASARRSSRERCRRRPGSNRAGVAGRLLEGGNACLICSGPTGEAPWTTRSRARVDRAGAEKRAAVCGAADVGCPGPVRDLSGTPLSARANPRDRSARPWHAVREARRRSWPRSRPLTSRAGRRRRSCTSSSARTSKRSSPTPASTTTAGCLATSSRSCALTCVRGLQSGLHAGSLRRVRPRSARRLLVPAAASARAAAAGAWQTRRRSWSIGSCPDVPVRQYVLSLPYELRRLAAFKADVLTALARIFVEAIFASYRARAKRTGIEDAQCGAVNFVQRFGSLNLNVHFHSSSSTACSPATRSGRALFHPAAAPTRADLEAIVARTRAARGVAAPPRLPGRAPLEERSNEPPAQTALDACAAIAMGRGQVATLPRDGRSDDDGQARPTSAPTSPRSRSNATASTCTPACASKPATTSVANGSVRYGARPPLSLERLRRLPGGRVAYRLKYVSRGRRGKHRVMTGMEFMARLAAIICPPRYPLTQIRGRARTAQRVAARGRAQAARAAAMRCDAARAEQPRAADKPTAQGRNGSEVATSARPIRGTLPAEGAATATGPAPADDALQAPPRLAHARRRTAAAGRRHRARAEHALRAALGSAARRRALRRPAAGGLGDAAAPVSPWTFSSARSATAGCACSPSSPSASPCAASSRTSGCRPTPPPSPERATRPTTSGRRARRRSSPSASRKARGGEAGARAKTGADGARRPRCALELLNLVRSCHIPVGT